MKCITINFSKENLIEDRIQVTPKSGWRPHQISIGYPADPTFIQVGAFDSEKMVKSKNGMFFITDALYQWSRKHGRPYLTHVVKSEYDRPGMLLLVKIPFPEKENINVLPFKIYGDKAHVLACDVFESSSSSIPHLKEMQMVLACYASGEVLMEWNDGEAPSYHIKVGRDMRLVVGGDVTPDKELHLKHEHLTLEKSFLAVNEKEMDKTIHLQKKKTA